MGPAGLGLFTLQAGRSNDKSEIGFTVGLNKGCMRGPGEKHRCFGGAEVAE